MAMTERSTVRKSIRNLTQDDSKILGTNIVKRQARSALPTQIGTKSFQTVHSSWTPVVNKPSNEQIYKERRDLVCHWFDLWTDSQRKRFLYVVMNMSDRSQLFFIRDWFEERVPILRTDFTNLLPRFLSLYIFSFLDPRSLSRASQVCWHWRFLAEQDIIWQPKVLRNGWYLPYTPTTTEFGAWKRHYVSCTLSMDMVSPKKGDQVYGMRSTGFQETKSKRTSATKLDLEESKAVMASRPAWKISSAHPKDVDLATRAFYSDFNVNDPDLGSHNDTLIHNKWGQIDPVKRRGLAQTTTFGLQLSARQDGHRMPKGHLRKDIWKSRDTMPTITRSANVITLSQSMQMTKFEEERLTGIIEMEWNPPHRQLHQQGPNMSGGGRAYNLPWHRMEGDDIIEANRLRGLSANFPGHIHPRIVFISSKVPSADLLLNAVMFGVIPIVYEYEGTSLYTLLYRLEHTLRGRLAQSIGIVAHAQGVGEMRLVQGAILSLALLDHAPVRQFCETLATHVLPAAEGGHVDLFAPFGATKIGSELLAQLNILTEVPFLAPTGITGNFNNLNSHWTGCGEGLHPPELYFEPNKLALWSTMADLAQEAMFRIREHMRGYFNQMYIDIAREITGQMLFDEISGIKEVWSSVVLALRELSLQERIDDPVLFVVEHLLRETETDGDALPCSLTSTSRGLLLSSRHLSSADQYGSWGAFASSSSGKKKKKETKEKKKKKGSGSESDSGSDSSSGSSSSSSSSSDSGSDSSGGKKNKKKKGKGKKKDKKEDDDNKKKKKKEKKKKKDDDDEDDGKEKKKKKKDKKDKKESESEEEDKKKKDKKDDEDGKDKKKDKKDKKRK